MTNKQKILFVTHNSVNSLSFGGVDVYLNSLAKYISSNYEVYYYGPSVGGSGKGIYLLYLGNEVIKSIEFDTSFTNWQLSCPARDASFIKLLEEFDFSLVHFHHLAGHPPSIIHAAIKFDIPTVFTFHDFYSICHVSNLISYEDIYCQPDKISLADCDSCLGKKFSIMSGSQEIRRKYWHALFANIDGLIFNTQGGFDLVSKIYPNIAKHPNLVFLPVAIEKMSHPEIPRKNDKGLKVAIIGNFTHHKGADYVLEAIELLVNEDIYFHFFGEVDKIYLDKLKSSKFTNVFLHNKYPPGKLPNELFSCQLSLHASICPETYSLALSEAWAAGLVPIVSDIGALSERVSHNINGLKVKVGSSEDLVKIIKSVNKDSKILDLNTQIISSLPISWMKWHSIEIVSFYKKILLNHKIRDKKSLLTLDFKSSNWALFEQQQERKINFTSKINKIFLRIKSKI